MGAVQAGSRSGPPPVRPPSHFHPWERDGLVPERIHRLLETSDAACALGRACVNVPLEGCGRHVCVCDGAGWRCANWSAVRASL